MKTIQELYDEIMGNQELKAKFIEAANAGTQKEFLKEHGCEATLDELAAFLKEKIEEDTPLSLDELENSAGGKCSKTDKETALSVCSFGVGCALIAVESWAQGHVGQKDGNEGRLCSSTSLFD